MAMTVCARRRKHSLILFAMLLIIAGAAAAVTGWTDTFKLGSPVKVSGRSPFINCTADNPASQPGTPITNSEVEPRLAVNPKNTSNLVAVWSQDFWTGPSNGSRGEVAGVSFDGGKSWQDVVIPGITLCSRGSAARSADSWLTFAPNGDLYHTALGLGVANDPMTLLVSKSTDAGLNWGPVTTLEDDTGTTNFPDKDSMAARPGIHPGPSSIREPITSRITIRSSCCRTGLWLTSSPSSSRPPSKTASRTTSTSFPPSGRRTGV